MKKKYSDMTAEELKSELTRLKQELEDLEDDKEMMLSQSGQHISSASIISRFDVMFEELRDKIAEVNTLLEK